MKSRTLACFLVFCSGVAAQAINAQGTREDYQRAEQFLPGNLRHRVYIADVAPHWVAKTNRFWFRKSSPKGAEISSRRHSAKHHQTPFRSGAFRGRPLPHRASRIPFRTIPGWISPSMRMESSWADYNGIAALNGRVYGVWTQKPENKSSRDTMIQIGVADFSGPPSPPASN
jgi:hypothetical protein